MRRLVRGLRQRGTLTIGVRFAFDTSRALIGLVHSFRGEALNLRAASLTFFSTFALVPMAIVALAALQLFHQTAFQQSITRFLQDMLAPGLRHESAAFFQRFLTAASSRAAGGLSLLLLLTSALGLLRHLDASLNEIWAVRRQRPLAVSLLLYALLLTLGPLVLGLWLGGTASIRRLWLGADLPFAAQVFRLGTAALSVGALTFIYKLAPHAPVRLRSALAGGLVAGVGWEIAKAGYAGFAELVFRYNPIWGSLSAVPLFFLWLYLSWWLVLFGARLSYVVEHAEFRGQFLDLADHPRARELVGAGIAQLTAAAHAKGAPPPSAREIAGRLRVPPKLVLEVAHLLAKAGLIQLQHGGLWPARNPAELTLADLSAAVGGVAKLLSGAPSLAGELHRIGRLFAEVDELSVHRLARMSWASLVVTSAPDAAGDSENP